MRVIGGIKGSLRIKSSKSKSLRPTMDRVRETVFNILGNRVSDAFFLDLFAGTGSVGIEALSRGAREVIFVEKEFRTAKILNENLERLGFEKGGTILKMDFSRAIKSIKRDGKQFDIVYIDPPYASELCEESLNLLAEYDIINKNGIVLAEHFYKNKLKEIFGELKLTRIKKIGETCISIFKKEIN